MNAYAKPMIVNTSSIHGIFPLVGGLVAGSATGAAVGAAAGAALHAAASVAAEVAINAAAAGITSQAAQATKGSNIINSVYTRTLTARKDLAVE